MSVTRLIPIFSLTFIVAYQIDDYFNFPLFKYYPDLARFSFGRIPSGHNAIGWYGWMAVALIVAIVVTAVYAIVPRTVTDKISWDKAAVFVPICIVLFALYIVVTGWWITL
jgi:hypothetical protein